MRDSDCLPPAQVNFGSDPGAGWDFTRCVFVGFSGERGRQGEGELGSLGVDSGSRSV